MCIFSLSVTVWVNVLISEATI